MLYQVVDLEGGSSRESEGQRQKQNSSSFTLHFIWRFFFFYLVFFVSAPFCRILAVYFRLLYFFSNLFDVKDA